jgi:osmoprotectant transport system permease protein
MSVIITGVRVALVIAIGGATIAAAVGAGGLGLFIFRGIRQFDNNLLLAGAVPAALLALSADFGLGLLEKHFSIDRRRKAGTASGRKIISFAAAAAIVVAMVTVIYLGARDSRSAKSQANGARVVVGSKDFTESAILGEIVAQMIEARDVEVERKFELGGNLPHDAMLSGKLDLYPEYTGTAYTAILKHAPITDPRAVYEQVKQEYANKFNVVVSEPLGFENTFAILVRGADARRLKLKTISDAIPYARNWRAGFGQDFMSRADGYPGFAKAYGLRFAEAPREMDLSLTYIALASGQVDLIAGNSTEGRIAALDLFQLEDDRHYFPPYEAVYLVRSDSLSRSVDLKEILGKLARAISTEEMRRLNYEVDSNKRGQAEVVREWLKKKGFYVQRTLSAQTLQLRRSECL